MLKEVSMKQIDVYRLSVQLLKEVAVKHPERTVVVSTKEAVTVDEVATALDKISKWVYADFYAEDIDKVVRCKNCKFYKKYRKKNAFKAHSFQACSKDKKKRDPMFFCKEGEER